MKTQQVTQHVAACDTDWMQCPYCEDSRIANLEDISCLSDTLIVKRVQCLACNEIWREVYEASRREITRVQYQPELGDHIAFNRMRQVPCDIHMDHCKVTEQPR